MQINVCFASDNNYVQYMATSIISILKNANSDDELNFYILSNNIKQEYKDKILELKKIKRCKITFLDVDEQEFKNCPTFNNHITITMYYRYKIANLLPLINKIIYLDCDVIVKQSLKELFSINLNNNIIGAVEDIGYTSLQKNGSKHYIFKGFYINSGILLIDLKKWRENNIEQNLFEFTQNNIDKISIGDQDVINGVLKDRIYPIDYKWNVQDSFYRYKNNEVKQHINKFEIIKASKRPAIIHYTFKYKPWNCVKMPRSYDWWYYNKYSPFLEKKSLTQYYVLWIKYILKGFFSISDENGYKRLRFLGIKLRLFKLYY